MGPPYSLHEDIEYGARIKRKGFKICKLNNVIALHLTAEHDARTRQLGYKRRLLTSPFRWVISYLSPRYGYSYYRFIKQLSLIDKMKWILNGLVPALLLGALIELLTYHHLIITKILVLITVITCTLIIVEYWNRRKVYALLIYSAIALILRAIRMIGITSYLLTRVTQRFKL